jgi:hypothetical protein
MRNKTATLILLALLYSGFASAQALFAERISTPDGTINFLIGLSPESVQTVTRSDGTSYCTVKMVLINDEKAQSFEWEDYKIYILTKTGELFYNYTTTAESGEYACKYTLQPGESRTQLTCFGKTFKSTEIDRVWLSISDNLSFELVYSND